MAPQCNGSRTATLPLQGFPLFSAVCPSRECFQLFPVPSDRSHHNPATCEWVNMGWQEDVSAQEWLSVSVTLPKFNDNANWDGLLRPHNYVRNLLVSTDRAWECWLVSQPQTTYKYKVCFGRQEALYTPLFPHMDSMQNQMPHVRETTRHQLPVESMA